MAALNPVVETHRPKTYLKPHDPIASPKYSYVELTELDNRSYTRDSWLNSPCALHS